MVVKSKETADMTDWFGDLTQREGNPSATRFNMDPNDAKNGLGQLVLTLIKLLHEVLERQALRRIETGELSEDEIERLGLTLMKQAEEIERMRELLNLKPEDLNIDLGPLGKIF